MDRFVLKSEYRPTGDQPEAIEGLVQGIKEGKRKRRGVTFSMEIIRLVDRPEMIGIMADWFNQKWGIPRESYIDSMDECLKGMAPVPQWYVALEGKRIIGGVGIIENDFHDRKDLSPNVCALYVEPDFRGRGIAGAMLNFVCEEMRKGGIDTLYLITDHTSFYERYGWEFLCNVNEDGGGTARMYVHK